MWSEAAKDNLDRETRAITASILHLTHGGAIVANDGLCADNAQAGGRIGGDAPARNGSISMRLAADSRGLAAHRGPRRVFA